MSQDLKPWGQMSPDALDVMRELGNFGPTVRNEVKGYMWDDESCGNVKTYFDADDRRRIAAACTEVADWLEQRAARAQEPKP